MRLVLNSIFLVGGASMIGAAVSQNHAMLADLNSRISAQFTDPARSQDIAMQGPEMWLPYMAIAGVVLAFIGLLGMVRGDPASAGQGGGILSNLLVMVAIIGGILWISQQIMVGSMLSSAYTQQITPRPLSPNSGFADVYRNIEREIGGSIPRAVEGITRKPGQDEN
jgi:uncharacterized membrane protein